MEIAHAELSAICHAVGVMDPEESDDLHNLPMVIRVVCEPREDTGELTNEIKGYYPLDSSVASAPTLTSASGHCCAGSRGQCGGGAGHQHSAGDDVVPPAAVNNRQLPRRGCAESTALSIASHD